MPISRLLPVSLLIAIAVCAAQLQAQSSTAKTPTAIQSADFAQQNPSSSPELLAFFPSLLFPSFQTEQGPAEPLNRIHVDEYNPRSTQLTVPRFLLRNQDLQSQDDDSLCYTVRSYKVARDNPQSDSTHAVGSSTCQPAARFHTHSIELRTSQPAP
jgi:hypothetical protein